MQRIAAPVIAMAGMSAYVALYHLTLHFRRPDPSHKDLRFAVMAALIGLYDLFCVGLYDSTSVAEGREWQRLQLATLCAVGVALVYFVDAYSGTLGSKNVRRLAWFWPALGTLALVERHGLLFSSSESVKRIELPWFGEVVYYESGPGPLLYLITAMIPLALVYIARAAYTMWNEGGEQRRHARWFLLAFALFLVGATNDGLVAAGWMRGVYVIEYAWTSTVLFVGYGLSGEVVDAALSKQALAESRERLAHAERLESVGQLAGGVAHDLNNMLTPVLAYAQLAQRKLPKDAPEREYLEHVIAAAERAAALTRQLLAFGRKQVLEVRPIDAGQALREIEPLLLRLLPEGITLQLIIDEPLPTIAADAAQLEQVWMNLVANARDSMPGVGTITVHAFEMRMPDIAPRLVVTVADTGEGMDQATKDRVFEPFFTTKPRGKGTGLGLSTVHGIVRQHGGRITVESERGQGALFRIVFPAIARIEPMAVTRREGGPDTTGTERILVVDDEPAVQDLVRDVLGSLGYHVSAAGSEAELRDVLNATTEPFDLLLTDVVLPDTDGTRISAIVAKYHPDASVLYMSGHADDVLRTRGVRRGSVELLQKPFTADALASRVRGVLNAAAQARGPDGNE